MARIQDTSLHSPPINTLPELSTHKSQYISFTFTKEEDEVIKKKKPGIQRRWLAGCRKEFRCAENFTFSESLPTQTL